MKIVCLRVPRASFYDIRHDRNGRATHLGGKPEQLFLGTTPSNFVYVDDQGICPFKGAQFCVVPHEINPMRPDGLLPQTYDPISTGTRGMVA